MPARVIRLNPSARARRDADRLAREVIEALVAFRAGDAGACHDANWAMARLMGEVFRHRLDLDEQWAS